MMDRNGRALKRLADSRTAVFLVTLGAFIFTLSVESPAMHLSFQEKDLGAFPSDWKTRASEGEDVYSVRTDGTGIFLHAESIGNSHAIGRDLSVDPQQYPYLDFAWRAVSLPPGASEESRATNDGALGVYVVFAGWSMPPYSIKYVWSSTLPEGTVTSSPFSSKTKIVVLRSGSENVGEWVDESVNIPADYRRLFGDDDVPRIRAIGILTDSDNTGTSAAGDYRGFRFSRGEEKISSLSP